MALPVHQPRKTPTMTSEYDGPHRKHRMVLKLEADSIDDLSGALTQLALDLDMDDMRGRDWTERVDRASGGPSSGYQLDMVTDPNMDHDTYIQLLNAWLDSDRQRRQAERAGE